jgi:hypothetical protein
VLRVLQPVLVSAANLPKAVQIGGRIAAKDVPVSGRGIRNDAADLIEGRLLPPIVHEHD